MLKLSDDGERIMTSGGANVPVTCAAKLWRLVEGCKASSQQWTPDPNRNGVRLGQYMLDSVSSDGSVKVGCHGFQYEELRRMAIQLGLAKRTLVERLTGRT